MLIHGCCRACIDLKGHKARQPTRHGKGARHYTCLVATAQDDERLHDCAAQRRVQHRRMHIQQVHQLGHKPGCELLELAGYLQGKKALS